MSSIPQLLKQAYETKNWEIVSQAYYELTNSKLDSAQAAIYQPKQQPKYEMPTSPTGGNKKYARPEAIDLNKTKYNTFVDDGTEAVEDKAIDKILCKNGPGAKGVRESSLVNVICRQCNKTVTVNRAILNSKRYLCDECIGKQPH